MKYIHFVFDTPFCGTDQHEFFKVSDDTPEEELNAHLSEGAYENGESFSYLATGWDEDWEDEEDKEIYFKECEEASFWEELSQEEWESKRQDPYDSVEFLGL